MNAIPFSPEMLQKLLHTRAIHPTASQSLAIQARVLTDLLAHVHRANPFKGGDLVQQLPEFCCYREPAVGKLGIVTGFLGGEPAVSAHRGVIERNDIIVLVYAGEEVGWYEFPAESWRFKKYEGEVA